MKITPENTIHIASVNVHMLEVLLVLLRTHGSVYVEVAEGYHKEDVPTLAGVLFGDR
jgi:hypothetical protein